MDDCRMLFFWHSYVGRNTWWVVFSARTVLFFMCAQRTCRVHIQDPLVRPLQPIHLTLHTWQSKKLTFSWGAFHSNWASWQQKRQDSEEQLRNFLGFSFRQGKCSLQPLFRMNLFFFGLSTGSIAVKCTSQKGEFLWLPLHTSSSSSSSSTTFRWGMRFGWLERFWDRIYVK